MDEKELGKIAKEITFHFLKLTQQRATSASIKKHITQSKAILKAGFTRDEILEVMEHVILIKKIDVYSLGYINACIVDVLRELNKLKEQDEMNRLKEEVKRQEQIAIANQATEVIVNDDSTERNRQKARAFSDLSRKRTKFDLDMFEGQRQDS